jgi:hypothetical protein
MALLAANNNNFKEVSDMGVIALGFLDSVAFWVGVAGMVVALKGMSSSGRWLIGSLATAAFLIYLAATKRGHGS